MPQNLLEPIKDFEDQFTVDCAKLKQIVNHFVKELEKGTFRLLAGVHRLRSIANTNPALQVLRSRVATS